MSACRACGVDPCVNRTLCAICRRADAKLAAERRAGRQSVSDDTLRARRLLADHVSLERAYAKMNDHPTPQVAIEAIIYAVRERGLAALKESANIEPLSRCNAGARAQINKRIERLESKRIAHD